MTTIKTFKLTGFYCQEFYRTIIINIHNLQMLKSSKHTYMYIKGIHSFLKCESPATKININKEMFNKLMGEK